MSDEIANELTGTEPRCGHCHRVLRKQRQSGVWFHPDTNRQDCLKSDWEDEPYTTAWPMSEWLTANPEYA